MRLFVQSIKGNIRIWFRQLRENSIPSWNRLTNIFKNQWGVKKDPIYFVTKFEELKINLGEPMDDFIKKV